MDELLPGVDGERTPLPVLACPLSVDLRVADDVGVFPGVNLGMRLGVVESKKRTRRGLDNCWTRHKSRAGPKAGELVRLP